MGNRLANERDNVKDDDDDSEARRLCNRISTTLRKQDQTSDVS